MSYASEELLLGQCGVGSYHCSDYAKVVLVLLEIQDLLSFYSWYVLVSKLISREMGVEEPEYFFFVVLAGVSALSSGLPLGWKQWPAQHIFSCFPQFLCAIYCPT